MTVLARNRIHSVPNLSLMRVPFGSLSGMAVSCKARVGRPRFGCEAGSGRVTIVGTARVIYCFYILLTLSCSGRLILRQRLASVQLLPKYWLRF